MQCVGGAATIAADEDAVTAEQRIAEELRRAGDRILERKQLRAQPNSVLQCVADDPPAHRTTSLSTGRVASSSRASRITVSSGTVHAAALPTSVLGLPTATSLPL